MPLFGDDILVRTLLLPPQLPRRWLARGRLDKLLSRAVEYPLTVVRASAGYGKSTALASFAGGGEVQSIWYTLGEDCDDPVVFLVRLVQACRNHPAITLKSEIGKRALDILQHGGSRAQVWSRALDALINDLFSIITRDTLLIFDDYQTVDEHPDIRALIERLIAMRPPMLHLLLSTRHQPQLASLPTLRVRGELLEIGEQDLAFTQEEIAQLFSRAYGRGLGSEEATVVKEQTGGWAIALQLVWQSMEKQKVDSQGQKTVDDARWATQYAIRNTQYEVHESLFAYLAQEVLANQLMEIQDFLLSSSILSELDAAACDYILGTTESAARLDTTYKRGLFLTALSEGVYRFHPLFHAFLRERAEATLPDWKDLHFRAAEYYREVGVGEQVLYHLLAIRDSDGAAHELEHWAPAWLQSGRLVTLLAWTDQLPEEVLAAHPQLLIARGDAARLLARFNSALRAYEQAGHIYGRCVDQEVASGAGVQAAQGSLSGQAQALRGQALVYLDTLQPVKAEAFLRRAYKLLSPNEQSERAELLRLIAENKMNMGRADQALSIYALAGRLSQEVSSHPGAGAIGARVLLHLGRLSEARSRLEAELTRDRESVSKGRPSEAHREITLLLSLIGALEGDPAAALRYAQEGLDAALRLGSTMFEAGARICAGHAWQLAHPQDHRTANEYYLQAIALADAIQVQRTKAEAYMGLALLHGFRGDFAAAEDAAREGLAIVEQSGDEWTAAQLETTLGAVAVANGVSGAFGWLDKALSSFRRSKDTYGQAVAFVWMSVGHYRAGENEKATHYAIEAFDLVQRHGYGALLTSPTLFGPRDRMMLVPLLLAARSFGASKGAAWASEAQSLLSRGFPGIAADEVTHLYHPGVTLRIQAFGPLRVWRGNREVGPHEWQRKKAQQLLALLITNRDRWLLREQICDRLWPDEGQEEAEAQFKVTLNGLNAALEPLRHPRTPPYYIRRQGGAYRFCPPEGVWLDVAEFEAVIERCVQSPKSKVQSAQSDTARAVGRGDTSQSSLDFGLWTLDQAAELAAAVELYQGEYLSEWLYEDWARDERERLASRYMEAATGLADALVGRNELSEAIRLCELVLGRDPGWEDAYCVLMQAYARQGQRRMAVATYERCVRNLREHLDLEPLPRTVRIYEQARS